MRVGLVCPYDLAAPGGVQQVVIELAARLRDGGDEPVVVAPAGGPVSVSGIAVEPVGRPLRARANASIAPVAIGPRVMGRVRRALAACDVVHVHEPFVPITGWAALSTGLPTVATFHADPTRWTRRLYALATPIARRVLRHTLLTAVSPVAEGAVPDRWGEVRRVPNAIDVASYRADVVRMPTRVAFLGRDEPRKGLDVLLAAWPAVLRVAPAAELVVIGAERADSIPGVRFAGRVADDEKRRLLASSAVFVAPNLGGESFGIVVIEAMAAGCAVVASDLPAFRHVLDNTGLVVPRGRLDLLAAAISRLVGDPATRETIADACRERAGRYDWPTVVGTYRALYRQAIAGG